nr:MAG TPA: hypothetical protein [Caudoviricetes sp.]
MYWVTFITHSRYTFLIRGLARDYHIISDLGFPR